MFLCFFVKEHRAFKILLIVNSIIFIRLRACFKDREIRFLVSLHPENQTSAKTISLVTVRITDVNDNKPRFGSSLERVLIPEDSPIGSGITVLSATDVDAIGPNSKIRYFLEGV